MTETSAVNDSPRKGFFPILSRSLVNTGRQLELDFLKMVLIWVMVQDHVQCYIFSKEPEDYGLINQSDHLLMGLNIMVCCAAALFMFMMGISCIYSRRSTPADYLRRGNHLFFLAMMVNLIRTPLQMYSLSIPFTWTTFLTQVFWNDILFFAAFFFWLLALLARFRVPLAGVIGICVGSFALSHFVNLGDWAANPVLLSVVGHFVYTSESSFPLLSWLIYPAVGMLMGVLMKHIVNKTSFYVVYSTLAAVLLAGLAWYANQNGWLTWEQFSNVNYHTEYDYNINWYTIVWVLPLLVAYQCVSYWISLGYSRAQKVQEWVGYIAKNLTNIYVAHWIILPFVSCVYPHHQASVLEIESLTIGILLAAIFAQEAYKNIRGKMAAKKN